MTMQHGLEQSLRGWLRGHEAMPDYLPEVFGVTVRTPQRRPSITARLFDRREEQFPVAHGRLVTAAVVCVLVATVLGSALLLAGKVPIPEPSIPTPPPTHQRSLPVTLAPTASSPPASQHAFDPRKDPFPAPLRLEPLSGAPVVEAFIRPDLSPGGSLHAWFDPRDDGEPEVDPRVDLVTVDFVPIGGCLTTHAICASYETAQLLDRDAGLPDPEIEWIAYGMVMDLDADGQPDQRFGIDSLASGAPGTTFGRLHRAWLTNLDAGATSVVPGDGFYGESELPFSTNTRQPNRGYMWVRAPLVTPLGEPSGRFYLWSALIRDGRIVSLDFAPDSGWLQVLPPASDLP